MTRFFMFGKYSREALSGISASRTDKVIALIKNNGGELQSMYTLLGEFDLVIIVDFPSLEQVVKTSVALQKLTGISFSTSPVVEVAEFDELVGTEGQ